MTFYEEQGTWQCWECARKEGIVQGYGNGKTVLFPICGVCGLSMHWAKVPCPSREKQEGTEQ